jgi:hypothetical protein
MPASRDFQRTEKAVRKENYPTFYTSNLTDGEQQKVEYQRQNRFEGRSAYFSYYPTDQLFEQKLESVWWEHQNRKLQEKRTEEESK